MSCGDPWWNASGFMHPWYATGMQNTSQQLANQYAQYGNQHQTPDWLVDEMKRKLNFVASPPPQCWTCEYCGCDHPMADFRCDSCGARRRKQ